MILKCIITLILYEHIILINILIEFEMRKIYKFHNHLQKNVNSLHNELKILILITPKLL